VGSLVQPLSPWFHVVRHQPQRPRLVCFPFAGGGVTAFRSWSEGLADVAEVVVARMPGRESRIAEPALDDVGAMARQAADALASIVGSTPERPFALFGHSLGAVVALEVARHLAARGGPQPRALFASGHRGPKSPERGEKVSQLPRAELIEKLAELAGTPREVLANRELMDVLLPTVRADFAAAESYTRPPGPPLALPIRVYAGRNDEHTPPAARATWADETTHPVAERVFDGGHFFIQSAQAEVWAALRADLGAIFVGDERVGR